MEPSEQLLHKRRILDSVQRHNPLINSLAELCLSEGLCTVHYFLIYAMRYNDFIEKLKKQRELLDHGQGDDWTCIADNLIRHWADPHSGTLELLYRLAAWLPPYIPSTEVPALAKRQ